MRQASKRIPESAEKTVRDIRRATRRHHSAEEKIRIVLEGLRGEDSIAELCRKEGINQKLYYRWSKEFLEAGKKRPAKRSALPPEKFCDRQNGSSRGTYLLSRSKPRNSTTARLASFSRRFASSPSRLSELRQLLRCEHTYNLSDFPC